MAKPKKPRADPVEPRPPATASEIASAAFGLAILEAHDSAGGDVVAGDAAVYEMLSLLALECLGMLYGRDPAGFGYLLNGLGLCASMRSAETMHSALAGVRPPPLGALLAPATMH